MNLLKLHQEIKGLEHRRSVLTIDAMSKIQKDVDGINEKIKKLRADMDAKVSALAEAARKAENKPTGVVNIEAEGVRIKHNRQKSITWDQETLIGIVERISASGDDPSEYVTTTYKVDEKKFTAWPKVIQKIFLPARTSKPGKPSYQIKVPEPTVPVMPGK